MKRKIVPDQFDDLEFYAPLLHDGEISSLLKEFPTAKCYHYDLEFSESYFNYWKEILKDRKDRRGEVIFAIGRDNKMLVHTKAYYPNSVFRLMTGGVHQNEKVIDSLHREVFEETGMKITSSDLVGILFYRFRHGSQSLPFLSYLFYLSTDPDSPIVTDPGEDIAEFQWTDFDRWNEIMSALRRVPDDWQDWAKMRLIGHQVIQEYLAGRDPNKMVVLPAI